MELAQESFAVGCLLILFVCVQIVYPFQNEEVDGSAIYVDLKEMKYLNDVNVNEMYMS